MVSFIAFISQRDKLDPKSSYLPKARKVGSAIAEIQTLTAEFSPLPAGVLALSLWRRSSRHFGGVCSLSVASPGVCGGTGAGFSGRWRLPANFDTICQAECIDTLPRV